MDTSKTRVLLQEAVKIFVAGPKSKTWDIHGMPQFITTTHKAFQIPWLNIVHHLEDEASSESDKKVEWYSDCHNNLTDNVRMVENKASAEQDRR